MINSQIIVDEALTWLNTPYHHNEMTKGQGVDCGHLLLGTLIGAGILDKDQIKIPYYSNEWHLHRAKEMFLGYVEKVCDQVEMMQKGDFLLYQYGRCISHGGIYLGEGKVIHAYIEQGVVISPLNDIVFYDSKGRSRLRRIYRVRGVN